MSTTEPVPRSVGIYASGVFLLAAGVTALENVALSCLLAGIAVTSLAFSCWAPEGNRVYLNLARLVKKPFSSASRSASEEGISHKDAAAQSDEPEKRHRSSDS